MGKLTGFTQLKGQDKDNASKGHNISLGVNPFSDGATFEVTGFGFTVPEEDNKPKEGARTLPVLETSLGNLYLSLLTRRKVTSDGRILTPNGTLNVAVKEIVAANAGKTDGEILSAICEDPRVKGRKIKVQRTEFLAKSRVGVEYPTDLLEFFID